MSSSTSPSAPKASPAPNPTLTPNRSSLTSPPKNPSNPTSALKRQSGLNPSRSNSMNAHGSSDELERERAKVSSLKALITAAEEREAEAKEQCSLWRSKLDQLSVTIDRMEAELAQAQELKSHCDRITKELERLKAVHKEADRNQSRQLEEFEASRAAWAEEEANLRSKLSASNSQLASLQKLDSHRTIDEQHHPEISSQSCDSPDPVQPVNPSPSQDQTATLTAELTAIKEQQSTTQASMDQALANVEALKAQLADLERLNEQLMDDNESYQVLVGERTLMGGFDVKQLLRVDVDDPTVSVPRRFSPSSSTSPSLEGVEEEDEDDEDPDATIERAVLESHGNGSRTTGAVEAGISNSSKPKRFPNRRNEPGGMGLDLAAELAQAEDLVEENRKKVERQEQRRAKKINQDRDQEIKALQDTNKALVLYISKILDRISAHDGFEKVLSSDYAKDGTKSSIQQPSQSTTANHTNVNGSKGISAVNVAPKRTSWLQYFTGLRSPTTQTTAIKPLRLGTGATATSGTAGSKDRAELDENDDEVCARERRIAEMKLHGYHGSGSGTEGVLSAHATIRANRRSTSMYGRSTPLGINLDKGRRNSGEPGKAGAGKLALLPSIDSSLVPLSQAGLMKRTVEREKESKMNLEKGQASGFTEIEIRGHRMRPSATGGGTAPSRQSTTPNYPLSPDLRSMNSLSPALAKVPTPTSATYNASTSPGGIKDLKMTSELSNQINDHTNESLLARTARRISMMGGGK